MPLWRVALSVPPTVVGGALEPRTVDRTRSPCAPTDGFAVVPGGVSRFARDPGGAIVTTSHGGGVNDVWVLPG